jgi:hypothetical protein
MAVFMGAFPVPPGKEDEARRFAHDTLVRREEFDRSQERLRTTRDEWALQETPMGSLQIVRFEADGVGQAFAVSPSRQTPSMCGSGSVFSTRLVST